ncbi:exopolysaccharide biosynthesis protein [Gordoniibacillus kamchatkensis]|uniref:Exopolysaccharide biosynthesis protein n=1 Tax=Gordoniibacillus kamchatkensis TaxID=1590651 RepID=A0ABR5ALF2_9BACL|nr:phosphodiester glycosidase family protein [Paenibacillus sp. VKM B-2647]KIL41864.1 exopolysaccharide biosynthesis protein [Paenibacillus sp. VKM B-2647]
MNHVQQLNRLFLLACAPFIGALFWMLAMQTHISLPSLAGSPPGGVAAAGGIPSATAAASQLDKARASAGETKSVIEKFYQIYEQSTAITGDMLKVAAVQAARPAAIYDQRILAKLGQPIRSASSANIDLKLFNFGDDNYNGYALKVNLKSDKAMKLVLGKDKFGSAETTLSAASRYGAVAGVNAGGFADDSRGRFPLDTTIVGGKYVNGFFPSRDGTAFVGLSTGRKLIGGNFSSQADLDKLSPAFGATFVPVLLKNGDKQPIPSQWQTSPARAARTVVGSFKHDQLLFVVTNGNDESGNSGATLAELQARLQRLGIKDAYNLDGGGSSSLIFDGQVINRPSDGKLRPLPTHFLFFR